MNLPLAHSLALGLHSTHPLSCRFLAGLNESFPTMCGRSCGMPILLHILTDGCGARSQSNKGEPPADEDEEWVESESP